MTGRRILGGSAILAYVFLYAPILVVVAWKFGSSGETTLVSWHDADAPGTRDRLAAAGVVIRDLPGRNLLRASVGAWNDESDLERLLSAL